MKNSVERLLDVEASDALAEPLHENTPPPSEVPGEIDPEGSTPMDIEGTRRASGVFELLVYRNREGSWAFKLHVEDTTYGVNGDTLEGVMDRARALIAMVDGKA